MGTSFTLLEVGGWMVGWWKGVWGMGGVMLILIFMLRLVVVCGLLFPRGFKGWGGVNRGCILFFSFPFILVFGCLVVLGILGLLGLLLSEGEAGLM